MPISLTLDDMMKGLGGLYLYLTYVHQPLVGTAYGKIIQELEDRLKDTGTYSEEAAIKLMTSNVATMKALIEREIDQLRQEGYKVRFDDDKTQ